MLQHLTARFTAIVIVSFFWVSFIVGQADAVERSYVDSMEQLIAETPYDSVKTQLLDKLTFYHFDRGEGDAALRAARRMTESTMSSDSISQQGWAWKVRMICYGQFRGADSLRYAYNQLVESAKGCDGPACRYRLLNAKEVLGIWMSINDEHHESVRVLKEVLLEDFSREYDHSFDIHLRIANAYYWLGQYDSSLEHLNVALDTAEYYRDSTLIASALSKVSLIYLKQGNAMARRTAIERALKFKGLSVVSQVEFKQGLMASYGTTGELEQEYAIAKEVLGEYDCEHIEDCYPNVIGTIIRNLTDRGISTKELMDFVTIAESMIESRQYVLNHLPTSYLCNALARYYRDIDPGKSLSYLQHNLEVASRYRADTSNIYLQALQVMPAGYANLNDYKAAFHAMDTLRTYESTIQQRNSRIALANATVELDLKDHERARLAAERATELEKSTSALRTKIFIGLLLITLLIVGIIAFFYRRARRDKAAVQVALGEKEVLLREIHHRVKNNLQIISALLEKQARKSVDEQVRNLVREGQTRIQSMALIHQNLYQEDDLGHINIRNYLSELGQNVQRSLGLDRRIELDFQADEIKLDIDTAVPVGLILNELLTNSYKYAFSGVEEGRILVEFKQDQEGYHLSISDNGVGFSEESIKGKSTSVGLNLVRGLVSQLEGTMKWLDQDQGVMLAIKF